MLGVLRIFFGSAGTNQWIVLGCLLAAGLAEGIGLAGVLPVLSLAFGETGATSSPINAIVLGAFEAVGLPARFEVLLVIVVAGIVVKSLLIILAMRYVGYAVADVATNLRTKLINSLLDVQWGYFTRLPVGRIANAVSLEATRCGEAYSLAALMVSYLLQSMIYVTLAFLVSWQLALISLSIGSVIALALNVFVRISRRAGRRQTKRTMELVSHLSDALIGIKPLKAMSRHEHFTDLFDAKIDSLRTALRRQTISKQVVRNLQEPMLVIFLAIGFYLVMTQWTLQIAELIVMALLLERTVSAIGKVQQQLQKAVIVESAYWAVHTLIEEAAAEREPSSGTKRPTLTRSCALDDVSLSFGENAVLSGASMEIPANCLTVITGASGVGKTTITDLILGLHRPDRGHILIDGVPLDEIDIKAWRGMVGYVAQELTLFHDTILANVVLGDPSITQAQAETALKAAGAWQFVAELPDGVLTTVGERGTKLSGGQRQRIAIARALVNNPKMLILDEVTSAIEPATELEICKNISSLTDKLTILAITHRPVWVNAADRVYHLDSEGVTLSPAYNVHDQAV